MNLINALCLSKNKIDSLPKWRFISRYKERKNLKKVLNNFLLQDIFVISDGIVSFLLSVNMHDILKEVRFDEKFISVDLGVYEDDDGYIIENNITYYPKSNRFEIFYNNIQYTVYRNTKNCDAVNQLWNIVSEELKEKYIDIIYSINEYINSTEYLK